MNAAKQKLISAKNKVAEKKTVILGTIAVVVTTGAVIQRYALKQHDQFLKEKGLYDEFYTLNEED
ncbi:hypothetical protein SscP1EGY_42 [Streptomyces phage SscP1EGY]|nr:hypothetical protein SscP1EGY_42 [Streptomyces phage SscP1EGY]